MTRAALPVIASVLFVFSIGSAAKDDESPVSMRINIGKDDARTYDFANRPLRFMTCAGEVQIPLREIRSIKKETVGAMFTIETLRGDIWLAAPVDMTLRYHYLNSPRMIDLTRLPFDTIERTALPADAWKGWGYPELILKDGSRTHLDPDDLNVRVRNELGVWSLPLGSLRVIKIDCADGGRDVKAIAKFPSGHIEKFDVVASRGYFPARDCYGNRLKMLYSDIKGLLCRRGNEDAGEDQAVKDGRSQDRLQFILADGRREDRDLPYVCWEVTGGLASLSFPSYTVKGITLTGPGVRDPLVTTLYGERFVGRVLPRELKWTAEKGVTPPAPVNVGQLRAVRSEGPALPPPPDWPAWLLDSADAFIARTDQGDGVLFESVSEPGRDSIRAESVLDATRTSGGMFRVTLRNSTSLMCRPAARDVNVILLCNGARQRLPWSLVTRMSMDSAAVLSTPMPSAPEPAAASRPPSLVSGLPFGRWFKSRPASPADASRAPAPPPGRNAKPAPAANDTRQTVQTQFGPVALPRNLLTAVHNSPENAASSFITVFGEVFRGPGLARAEAARLSGRDVPKVLPADLSLGHAAQPVAAGWPAWRTRDGGCFYAKPVDAKLPVKRQPADKAPLDIAVASLTALRPAENGRFVFVTSDGETEAAPVARTVALQMLCGGDVCRVPFREIEAMIARPLESLPPPVSVVRDGTPLQEGMVSVAGGAFRLGRTAGEGMDDEGPPCDVRVSSFFADSCEVTRAQFAAFVEATGFKTDAEKTPLSPTWRSPGFDQRSDESVCCVSWFDAAQYCNWRSRKAGLEPCYEAGRRTEDLVCHRERSGYRLPTEAEWEFAARQGGQNLPYPWGSETNLEVLVALANFKQPPGGPQDKWPWTCPVKEFPPTSTGLYGLAGNVWEWCEDWYYPQAYAVFQSRQPQDPCNDTGFASAPTARSMRGGSYLNELDLLRCASRGHGVPSASNSRVGFRCVRRAPAK